MRLIFILLLLVWGVGSAVALDREAPPGKDCAEHLQATGEYARKLQEQRDYLEVQVAQYRAYITRMEAEIAAYHAKAAAETQKPVPAPNKEVMP